MENKTFIKFKTRAYNKFGNRYDYSQAVYINAQTPIKIICQEHGEFYQTTTNHLRTKCGCPKCGYKSFGDSKRKTTEQFIAEAKLVHGDKYDYSNVSYINNSTPVKIYCLKHQYEFSQIPSDHLSGKGCPKCGNERIAESRRSNTAEFIEKAKKIHNNTYDYSKVDYHSDCEPVIIICKKHGEFYQTPNNHLNGKGCKQCAIEYTKNIQTKTTEQFITEAKLIHGNYYDYSKTKYINANEKVEIICPKHGEFWQKANSHLQGCGCPKCILKSQYKLYNKLVKSFPNIEIIFETTPYSISWLDKQRFDIYFPKYNIAVEYNGIQHYIPVEHFGGILGFNETQKRNELKRKKCTENKCALFEVPYNYTDKDYNKLVNDIQTIIDTKDFN